MPQRQVSKDRATTVSSKNLIHSTELAVLVPIKRGLVEISTPMTYARRLELLLEALFDLRKEGVERSRGSFVGPLELLQTIHNVHWCILEDGAPVSGAVTKTQKLLLMVSFDQPWEPYIRVIVDKAGPLLDLIFCHCEGFVNSSSAHGYENFARFVRNGQRDCQYFASAHPELTVDDQRYLKQFRDLQVGTHPDELPLRAVVEPLTPCRPAIDEGDRLLRLLGELFRTRNLFPENGAPTSENGKPSNGSGAKPSDGGRAKPSNGSGALDRHITDRAYYDAAAELLIRGFLPMDREHEQFTIELLTKFTVRLGRQYRGLLQWYGERLDHIKHTRIDEGAVDARQTPVDKRAQIEANLQAGVLSEYKVMTHGCLVMLQFQGQHGVLAGSGEYIERLLALASDKSSPVHYNVAFTYSGLAKLFDNTTLRALPVEFQVGMEERAGLLGDLGDNHPSKWSLPQVNFPADRPPGVEVPLSTVDLVVLIQCHKDRPAKTKSGANEPSYAWTARHPLYSSVKDLARDSKRDPVRILHVEPLGRYSERKQPKNDRFAEHFGYVDGFSQPDPFASKAAPRAQRAALGDFLLGRCDSRGAPSPKPAHSAFDDGSFLVVRKLAQDVAAFDSFVSEQAALLNVTEPVLRARMMGRTDGGEPLALKAPRDAENNAFDYDEDRDGLGCPLQAHIRRANPRSMERPSVHGRPTQTPRIMRRGFPYGPIDGNDEERGLLFMAYNASIAEQFEVIQRWLNAANVTGLYGDQNDPIVGAGEPSRRRRFTFKDEKGAKSAALTRTFVKLQWGMYLFVPSLTGLQELAEQAKAIAVQRAHAEKTPPDIRLEQGRKLVGNLRRIERDAPDLAIVEWKKLLEDEGLEDEARSIWHFIREAEGGVLATPYGLLVASKELALNVLCDETTFSVSGYYERMKDSIGAMHLGMDRIAPNPAVCPKGYNESYASAFGELDYNRDSQINAWIARTTRAEAFRWARFHTLETFRAADAASKEFLEAPLATVDVALLGERVISLLSSIWFGFPEKSQLPELVDPRKPVPDHTLCISGHPVSPQDGRAYCPYDFTVASQYIFRPQPDKWAATHAIERGKQIQEAATAFLARTDPTTHPFLEFLHEKFATADLRRRGLVGAVDGFVAAVYGSFVSIIDRWIEDGELVAVQQEFQSALASLAAEKTPSELIEKGDAKLLSSPIRLPGGFEAYVLKTLKRRLVPLWVYRTTTRCTEIGHVTVAGGTQVIVNLGSAAAEDEGEDMIFGGERRTPYEIPPEQPPFAEKCRCPDVMAANVQLTAEVCTCQADGGVSAELGQHAADCRRAPVRVQAAAPGPAVHANPGKEAALTYPLHACPGREMAIGTLLGMISGILAQKNLRRESRLLLSFDP